MTPQSDSPTESQTEPPTEPGTELPGRNVKTSLTSPPRRKLLVVDRDAPTAPYVEACRQSGLVVTVADTSAAALETCQREPFDLALIDQHTVGATAFELARQLRDQYELRCIFLAPRDALKPIEAAADVGALGCFAKPADPVQVLLAIQIGLLRGGEIRALRAREGQLTTALNAERDINTAIGFLMERLQLPRPEAFEVLRQYARSQRQPVAQIAAKLLLSINDTNDLLAAIVQTNIRNKNKEHKHRPRREPN